MIKRLNSFDVSSGAAHFQEALSNELLTLEVSR